MTGGNQMGFSLWSRNTASMNNESRRAVVAALIELAGSPDYYDRADAGRALSSFAEMTEAQGPLLNLILGDGDTFVTQVTAEALLRRQDSAGLAVVASALSAIGSVDPNHVDWIYTAILDVFGARHFLVKLARQKVCRSACVIPLGEGVPRLARRLM